jgi:hypothetical protein
MEKAMKFAIILLAALTLTQPALSMAGANSKPTSYVPHHTNQRVYGSPIGAPIMGRAKTSHRQQAPKKHSR